MSSKWFGLILVLVLAGIPDESRSKEVRQPNQVSKAGNQRIEDFTAAKKWAAKIHQDHAETIYCGCPYKSKKVDIEACGYQPQKRNHRTTRLEWEHVVPAEAFGNSFVEWREGADHCVRKGRSFKGRRCAETNPEFSRMEADLYNLWPEIGELNGLRSNYSMAEIPGPADQFGRCEVKLRDRKFEPRPAVKGIVARVYMYMDQSYPGRGIISEKNQKLFEAWDKMYPTSKWECERARRVEEIQGNPNPILRARCNP